MDVSILGKTALLLLLSVCADSKPTGFWSAINSDRNLTVLFDGLNPNGVKNLWETANITRTVTLRVLRGPGRDTTTVVDDPQLFSQAIQRPEGETLLLKGYVLDALLESVTREGDVILFAGDAPNDSLESDYLEELGEANSKVYVVWTGDALEDKQAFQEIADVTSGSMESLLQLQKNGKKMLIKEDQKSLKINDKPNVTQDERIVTETLSRLLQPFEEKSQRVRFPESDGHLNGTTATNMQGGDVLGRQQGKSNLLIPLTVEVSSSSNLQATSGNQHRIQFDVKNNLYNQMPVFFMAAQPQNLRVIAVQPNRQIIEPMETAKVDVAIESNAPEGSEGLFHFVATVQGGGRIARQVMIKFTDRVLTDKTDPRITYSYKGDCKNHDKPDTCDTGEWKIEATLQDEDSGLKKVLSDPYGLIFTLPFIAGTRSPVTVSYSASCCQPKVAIWGEDGIGNYVKRDFDVNNQGLLTGELAAVVLASLLLLFIIIAIIVAIVIIRRRNRSTLIIPRYQGTRE